ncbi:MAG TPA: FeS-binding protein [Methylomusa anaerophila]|uniref:Epoxyqueuosine reductase n=1 Tax=Methylomusa anaerophila TaxID=1930071 RepID=A0A348AII2_9FIRM|nr:4Fe-4S double cluster binding domain-containing protein [Methylomusa anaerophila]BBB90880.1 epoxyqueuosine reductase [Methylomusa anaerophila]HML90599.1 FeS-binding protein [Methylomusa anaerophila]
MKSLRTALFAELENNGCQARIVPIHHLQNLRREMAELLQSGLVNNKLWGYLNGFQYDYSPVLSNPQSIIVAAVPQPITKLHIMWRGTKQTILVPPTYVYTTADNLVLNIMERELKKENFSLVRAKLPLKLLAVRSGLSYYGRNNISYIRGMGSFYRLIALVTDMPVSSGTWQNVQRMPECEDCQVCLNSCPARCIDLNRNIIHAEKCLTYINESPGPFPLWVDSNWHNSLVGCIKCQLACPQNKHVSQTNEFADILSERELDLILSASDYDGLPETTRYTLQKLNLTDYELTIIQRNLRALLL